jgi:translation initiation factor IF-2
MSIRVHDLAKKCGLSNKEMIEKLKTINYPVKSHSSTVDKITAESLLNEYGYVEPVASPPAPPPPAPVAEPPPPPQKPPAPPPPVTAPPVAPPVTSRAAVVAAPPPPPVQSKPVAPAVPTPPTPPVAAPTPPPKPVVAPPKIAAPVASPRPVMSSRPVPPPPPPLPRPAPPPVVTGPQFIVNEQGQKVIQMKPPLVVRDLAAKLGCKPHMLLADLMELNVFANINETIGEDIARKLCERRGYLFELEKRERGAGVVHAPPKKIEVLDEGEKQQDLAIRPPVVTVMGHVDHGKTSLLDAIRKTNVAASESGGITQHIGASVVKTEDGRLITFLDTPGHQAFTKMRARGANVTDIAILVVAADDGIMPQTIEAINHAKAAQVPIIVAINKCDLPAANPDRVKKQLQEYGLTPESWGGDTITVDVSATTRKGLDELLEMILLQADMLELKASPKTPAKGNVIEAQLEPGLGPTASVLVRKGTLHVGNAIICGPHGGKVRALLNDKGQRVKEATPSTPVKIIGLWGVPEAGTEFSVMKNEKEARSLSEQRQMEARTRATTEPRQTTIEELMAQIESGQKKTLNVVLKADVQGSVEAIADSLSKIKSDKVDLEIIHTAVGSITENDVLLASASKAIIIGFRVKTESGVTDVAKQAGVPIKLYSIIYELLEQVEDALKGLLEPETRETIVGRAEVRQVFELSKGAPVAGCVITTGRVVRSGRVRLLRRRLVQYEGKIASLRHFQDDVREVKAGQECGLRLDNYSDFQPGDVIECYTVEKVASVL